jgi:ubiquinol-cytochrome c reductase subunit 8
MRPSVALMAKHFGELATVRGIITYKLSPFEQRAFAGAISQGIPNIIRRIRAKMFIVAPRKYFMLLINQFVGKEC